MVAIGGGTLVFDLDGTLVRLAVDWDEAAEAAAAALESRGVSPSGDLWTMLEAADRTGHREAVEAVLADRERDEVTAERAGTDYVYVSEWLRAYA